MNTCADFLLLPWQTAWRDGLCPLLSDASLLAIERALVADDDRLIQGCTTLPEPCGLGWHTPIEGACLIGYSAWQGDGLCSIGEAAEYFARVCDECDGRLGSPGAMAGFLNWFDGTPREEMRRQLLPEVRYAIEARGLAPHQVAMLA